MRYRIGLRKHADYSLYLDAGSEEEARQKAQEAWHADPELPDAVREGEGGDDVYWLIEFAEEEGEEASQSEKEEVCAS